MSSIGAIPVKAGIPPRPRTLDFQNYRQQLPIRKYKTEILETVRANRFTVIKGTTGSGKTTQVPQYILEDALDSGEPVRIIDCIPRRVGVVAVCDRVTQERGESIGDTVGYTIRLESCTSPCETLLTFCTGPILVSALTSPGFKWLQTTTHIILDEVHARDRYTDFLLTCCRGIVDFFPKMKFVFLGENIYLEFLRYYFADFGTFGEVIVEGRDDVRIIYIDKILELLGKSDYHENHHQKTCNIWSTGPQQHCTKNGCEIDLREVDKFIENAWKDCNYDSSLDQFMHLVKNGEVSVDYQHSKTSLTMLMAVSGAGRIDTIKMLLDAGASLKITSLNGYTVFDWAKSLSQLEVLRVLEWERMVRGQTEIQTEIHSVSPLTEQQTKSHRRGKQHRNNMANSEHINVDLELIRELIHMIYLRDSTGGSILVFLPTYDDMASLKKMLCNSGDPQIGSEVFVVYFLHPHIQTGDHRAAFERPKPGVRKIILSTSIGESCLTFDDVVFVIDSGVNREYCYDNTSDVSVMKQCWISKSAANQRKGRAGRTAPGICYRLYSEQCFHIQMRNVPLPEICRAPLSSLCLQSRAIITEDITIAEFFADMPSPPPVIAVQKAVATLKSVGALDENEQLTYLGRHLLDYPIDPSLSKAVLYSVIFKCMDPVLTLAAAISYGESFTHQTDPKLKDLSHKCKVTLSDGTLSDHMSVLKAIQEWEEAKSYRDGDDEDYCNKHYISAPAFEIIYSIRSRLLGHLRATGFVRNKGACDVKDLNINSDNWAIVKGVLTAAFYSNICLVNRVQKTLFNDRFQQIRFHDTSVLSNMDMDWFKELPSDWVIFDEIFPNGRGEGVIKGCTLVSPASVALFGGLSLVQPQRQDLSLVLNNMHGSRLIVGRNEQESVCQKYENMYYVKIDNWTTMLSLEISLDSIISLRDRIKDTVLRRLQRPASFPTRDDQTVISTVARILSLEDSRIGMKAANVGQWPKLVSGNLMSTPRSGFEIAHDKH